MVKIYGSQNGGVVVPPLVFVERVSESTNGPWIIEYVKQS